MSETRRVYCTFCEQTFSTDADEDCPLCGKIGGLVDPTGKANETPLSQQADEAAETPPPKQLTDHYGGGLPALVLLTIGQVASLLACVLALAGIPFGLAALGQVQTASALQGSEYGPAQFFVVATGILHAMLWVGVCLVFGRAKAAANAAAWQDAENRRLWQALEALQSEAQPPSSPPTDSSAEVDARAGAVAE